MKIDIDTDRAQKWLSFHAKAVIPLGLIFLSWFSAERGSALDHGMALWWAVLSIVTGAVTGAGGLIFGMGYIFTALDLK